MRWFFLNICKYVNLISPKDERIFEIKKSPSRNDRLSRLPTLDTLNIARGLHSISLD